MFFSMAPRHIIAADSEANADVVHVNGDLYKLVPRNSFLLKSGDSTTLFFDFYGWQLKETDFPDGLFIVLYSDSGEETAILTINEYFRTPLTRPEQLTPLTSLESEFPTSENLYKKYRDDTLHPSASVIQIIPTPWEMEFREAELILNNQFVIQYSNGFREEAIYLSEKLDDLIGLKLQISMLDKPNRNQIRILPPGDEDLTANPEGYRLDIRENTIEIRGSKAGVFYGVQSLIQLLYKDIISQKKGTGRLPLGFIIDTPRFAYRGLHIDVCRNFQTKEQILKTLDLMAMYKLNKLHFYLTEDEGWRIEIRAIPELTTIGSKRGYSADPLEMLPPAYGSGPYPNPDLSYGSGYYTQDDFKEIIRFAADRHIEIIPSINLPGHARAAIVATEARYKKYILTDSVKANQFRLIDPDDTSRYLSAQFYNDNVVCVARESVYDFYETVIDELISIYAAAGLPLKTVHTGGDEVPEGVWAGSPLCRELPGRDGELTDPKNLQQHFFGRILEILDKRGIVAGGWEEIALTKNKYGGYEVNPAFASKNVRPYVWNDLWDSQDLAYRMANAGYPIVLCPVSACYLDLAYNADPKEPGLYWGGFTSERDPWVFDPFNMVSENNLSGTVGKQEFLKVHAKSNIAGLQAQLWHETIKGGEMMEYYLLPKLISFADRCWAPEPLWTHIKDVTRRTTIMEQEWHKFEYNLYTKFLPVLGFMNGGYAYRIPPAGVILENGCVLANTLHGAFQLRYTTNGEEPGPESQEYTSGIELQEQVNIRSFDRTGRPGRTTVLTRSE